MSEYGFFKIRKVKEKMMLEWYGIKEKIIPR